jgi:hypothetical protein
VYTLGEPVHLGITTYNDNTGVAEDAATVVLTIKAPDGTVGAPVTLTHVAASGVYDVYWTPPTVGRFVPTFTVTGTATVRGGVITEVVDIYGITVATPADLRARYTSGMGTSDLSSQALYPDSKLREALRGATDQWNALAGVNVAPFATQKSWIGDGQMTYLLQDVEVSSITSLTIDGTAVASTAYTLGDAGVIKLLVQQFTANKACTALYVSGYNTPPRPVVDAILQRAAELVLGSSVPSRTISQGGDLGYTRFSLAGRDGSTGIPDFDSTAALYGNNGAGGFA